MSDWPIFIPPTTDGCPCKYYTEESRIDDVIGVCECGHNDDEHDEEGVCGAGGTDGG